MACQDSQLVAILLITHARPGAKLVFHYPAEPMIRSKDPAASGESAQKNGLDIEAFRNGTETTSRAAEPDSDTGKANVDESVINGLLLGVSEDSLQRLLSPGRWSDRKRFEMSLNGLTFVGHPMFANQEGQWRTPRGDDQGDGPMTPKTQVAPTREDEPLSELDLTITESTPVKEPHDFSHVPESLESHGGLSLGTSLSSTSPASAGPEPITAFHVVFAVSAPKIGPSNHYVEDLYHHVAKKLSKALNYCQREASYVGLESRRLTALKAKAKQDGINRRLLCDQMVDNSELAWALKEIYETVSINAVAGFRLNGMEMSLQLPHTLADDGRILDRYSTIVLLEDREIISRELSHPEASPLAHFIRMYTPTKSLQKQVASLGMPINNILYLAQHLIKWRKARPTAPLHARNVYVVSHKAPLDQLSKHIADYARRFPGLQSLPQVLKILSGRPVKYGLLIPSRDHRGPYMEVLAYLIRHNFVEQLKTSGWFQAPPTPRKPVQVNENRRPLSVASLLSPQLRPVADDDAASVSSERTAIPLSIAEALKRQDTAILQSRTETAQSSDQKTPAIRIVTDPSNPTDEDLLSLEHIRNTIDDHELCDRLPSLYHYFDGEMTLEDIAAQEGLKRSVLDSWLELLGEAGFLLTYRHT